jgi:Fe-S oxidoreductase
MSYAYLKSLLVLFATLAAVGIFLRRVYLLLWRNLKLAQPAAPYSRWVERIQGGLVYVGGQLRLFRFLVPGSAHFFIFWGFLILSPTILQAILDGIFAFRGELFSLPLIGSWGIFALLQDLFAVMVAVAVLIDLYTRLIVRPERYRASHNTEGSIVLVFIILIVSSLFVMNAVQINLGELGLANWRPISSLIGSLFSGLTQATQSLIGETAYWIHLSVVLVFLTMLPGGKHFHVVTSLPAVLLRNLEPPGRLMGNSEKAGEGKSIPVSGVKHIHDFTWRQILDFYTCTECGRCQEMCPAYASGLELSPKLLMMKLRDHVIAQSMNLDHSSSGEDGLLGRVIPEEMIWSCTSCYACDQECPLFIEHVTPIVDMRRQLVLEGRVDPLLQESLANLGRYGNSFGKSERMRARWSKPLQTRIKDARKEPVEYLWFVGDYASYHPALTDITRKTAAVLQQAEVDFGILYDAERNSGNDIRRIGEEGLFEMMVERNSKGLANCDYRAIITTDPHTYNTLKNEYPVEIFHKNGSNGGVSILHISELLEELITTGRLKLTKPIQAVVSYHDPCYLGRYNGIYESPRNVLAATGCRLVEMPNHGDRATCCGAGGGRIWMEEGSIKERPAERRVREAAEIPGVSLLVVTCPKDVTMFSDAIKSTGVEEQIEVKDLVELVYEAM